MKRVPLSEIQQVSVELTDWPQILGDLKRAGVTVKGVARACNRDTGTVDNWKYKQVEPRHHEGQLVLALHRHFCGEKR